MLLSAALTHRRAFLATTGRAIIGASPYILFGCRTATKDADTRQSSGLREIIADLEQRIPRALADNAVPGLSIALVRGAQLVWRRGFGVADIASKAPVDAGTIFEAQSMGKPVFAYVVMKPCEMGVLDLDSRPWYKP